MNESPTQNTLTLIKRLTYLIALLIVMSTQLSAQDPVFSQFYNAPIQLNPGLVGLSTQAQVSINYRNQWPAWPQVYTSYAASYDQYFENLNSGFGLQILSDDAGRGILKTNQITGVYAYQLKLDNGMRARVGLEGGIISTQLDWDKLIFFEQLVPTGIEGGPGTLLPNTEVVPDQLNNFAIDLSVGGLFYSKDFYVGISLKHLNNPDNKFRSSNSGTYTGLPTRFIIHAGMQIDLDGYNKEGFGSFIAPSVLFTRQAGLSQLNAGVLYNQDRVFGGVWLRHTLSNLDAAIFSVGVRSEWVKFSYSFDLTISDAFVTRTAGSHEIGVLINVGGRQKERSRYEDCFSIFR